MSAVPRNGSQNGRPSACIDGQQCRVQTHFPWVQERIRTGAIELRKVHGWVNPADLFMKHLTFRDRVDQLVELLNCEHRDGRSAAAPGIRKDREPAAARSMQVEHDPDANNKPPTHNPDVASHVR